MKKVSLLLVILAGTWFTGCQKNSEPLGPETEASDFESVVESAARLAVESDSVTLGRCKGKLTEVATADLPAAVTAYIDSAYAGSEIKYAAKDLSGKIVVAITLADGSVKGLLFDADGTFKAELKQHVKKAKLTKIEVSALPATVTSYITSNYTGAEIKLAATNDAGEYYVGILVDSKVKILLFNVDGSFNKELEKPAFGRGHKRH
ncbi:PepSY-like domain-containing protein [Dyadobacter sp. BHUBP1]|uniref:PepSY-like domain-containing protein n=1 Tax=Dyadobacter sp. BHUBP1 TaxID=3424178 RepID=UPI003D35677C